MLKWAMQARLASLLDIPLSHITLGHAALYAAILEGASLVPCQAPLQHAVAGLRRAGTQDHLPRGLLTRGWLRFLEGHRTGPESAQSDMDEAWEIAERGLMPLYLVDIHLHRARLFFRETYYPWSSPRADLVAARQLIEKHGYWRRKEELVDAENIILRKPECPPPMSEVTAFISYSHDSDEHRERVLALSERLRSDGIATILDLYVEKGSPTEGWPRWMMNGLNAATHILCVCTETYRRRFLGQEVPDKGKGVDWEGALVTQALYDARSRTNKFIPVLFARSDESHIPEPLRSRTYYLLDSEASYQALYDAVLDQAGVEPGAVGELKRKPRATGQPLTFGDTVSAPAPAASSSSPTALNVWRDKLEFLLVEDAVCVDPAMKFRLNHLITEAQDKIRSLGGDN